MSKYQLLIDKFIDGSILPGEREILERWVVESEANLTFFKKRLKEVSRKSSVDFDADLAYKRFRQTLKSKKKDTRVYHMTIKYAAILVILFSIGFLVKEQLLPYKSGTSIKVVEIDKKQPIGNDIIIKLSDGSTRVLNSEDNEALKDTDGNIVATKGGNSLTFNNSKELVTSEKENNEIYIPFGQTFKLKLSDGTFVWLNAGSKLRFPKSFTDNGKNRMVYLEGEAFFDVAENKNMPFIINTQEINVKVLGTKFNVSSNETDDYITTTLVEGSVTVFETRTPENVLKLTPSFQAKYDKFGNKFSKTKVDTSIYTAWMQGRLVIDNLKFPEILTRLERRYAVKFVNKAENLNDKIYKGEFDDEDIETVLKTISLSTPFKYEINQNIITISK